MQFHIVMEVEFPETFQHVLDYMNWLKGDIITYFNVKGWAPSLEPTSRALCQAHLRDSQKA